MITSIQHPEHITNANSLNDWQKLSVYMHYYVKMITYKYKFDLWWKDRPIRTPNKTFKGVDFHYLHSNSKIQTYDEFVSEDNIKVTVDRGENWKEDGYGSRYHCVYGGIYDYFWKNMHEINLQ